MSNNLSIVYKVTTPSRQSTVGVNSHNNEIIEQFEWMTIKYHPFKWAYPIIGKIFAFKDLVSATWYVKSTYPRGIIWQAQAEINFDVNLSGVPLSGSFDVFHSFWNNPHNNLWRFRYLYPVPSGTIFCNKLRLIKKINL